MVIISYFCGVIEIDNGDMEIILKYFPHLTEEQIAKFRALKDLYQDWNSKINVISRKDMDNFYIHHVLHSLGVAAYFNFKPGTQIIDIGCGGGFPSIPLAIMFSEVQFTGVDSIGKKIKVVDEVSQALGLKNIQTFHSRVEQLPKDMVFDYVVSRAVTAFPDFVKFTKGRLKGRDAEPMATLVDSGQEVKSGIIYLKGGDFADEIKPFPTAKLYDLSAKFSEEFFETKKIICFEVRG